MGSEMINEKTFKLKKSIITNISFMENVPNRIYKAWTLYISEQIKTTAIKLIQEILMVNQLVCKNQLTNQLSATLQHFLEKSQKQSPGKKKKLGNGSYVNTSREINTSMSMHFKLQ